MPDLSKLSSRFKNRITDEDIEIVEETPEDVSSSENLHPDKENSSELNKGKRSLKQFADKSDGVSFDNGTDLQNEQENVFVTPEIYDDLFPAENKYKSLLLEKIKSVPVWYEYGTEKQKELVADFLSNKLIEDGFDIEKKSVLIDRLFSAVTGFGPLDYLLKNEKVDAVYVNGENSVHIEISGKILNTEIKLNKTHIDFIVNNILHYAEIKPDENSYIWNCKINDMYISVIFPPVSQDGISIIIKKSDVSSITPRELVKNGFVSKEILDFLISAAALKKNILICGEADSGKTNLINCMINSYIKGKRGILIQEFPQIVSNNELLMKFDLSQVYCEADFFKLLRSLSAVKPEFYVFDINNFMYCANCFEILSGVKGLLLSVRASSLEDIVLNFGGFFDNSDKSKMPCNINLLSQTDYIVLLGKNSDDLKCVKSVLQVEKPINGLNSFKEVVFK